MARSYDFVSVTVSAAPGTGAFHLGSAVSGFLTFVQAGVPDGAVVPYAARDWSGNLEYGYGTYSLSGQTLTRTTILYSTNGGLGGSAVNFGASVWLWLTILAEDIAGAVETFVQLGSATSYALANGTVIYQRVLIVDNLGHASIVKPVISGNFNIGSSIVLEEDFQAIEPFWNGSLWVMA